MKPKVIFKFDINYDAWNYYCAANSNPRWGYDFSKAVNPEVVSNVRRKKWKNARDYLLKTLKRGYFSDKKVMKSKLKNIKLSWKKIERRYFERLEKITKRKIYTNNFRVYITTIGRCPYNDKENWFMVNVFSKDTSMTIAHELLHLQFLHYFKKNIKGKIGNEKFEDLKEALTMLLNIEFKDVIKEKDKGYPSHKKLRKFIVKQWKKEPDFDILIEKCIKYLKK